MDLAFNKASDAELATDGLREILGLDEVTELLPSLPVTSSPQPPQPPPQPPPLLNSSRQFSHPEGATNYSSPGLHHTASPLPALPPVGGYQPQQQPSPFQQPSTQAPQRCSDLANESLPIHSCAKALDLIQTPVSASSTSSPTCFQGTTGISWSPQPNIGQNIPNITDLKCRPREAGAPSLTFDPPGIHYSNTVTPVQVSFGTSEAQNNPLVSFNSKRTDSQVQLASRKCSVLPIRAAPQPQAPPSPLPISGIQLTPGRDNTTYLKPPPPYSAHEQVLPLTHANLPGVKSGSVQSLKKSEGQRLHTVLPNPNCLSQENKTFNNSVITSQSPIGDVPLKQTPSHIKESFGCGYIQHQNYPHSQTLTLRNFVQTSPPSSANVSCNRSNLLQPRGGRFPLLRPRIQSVNYRFSNPPKQQHRHTHQPRRRGRRPYLNIRAARAAGQQPIRPSTNIKVAPAGQLSGEPHNVQATTQPSSTSTTDSPCLTRVSPGPARIPTAYQQASSFIDADGCERRFGVELPSPSTPAFIDTDFTKDLFAEAEAQLAQLQGLKPANPDLDDVMDLSKSSDTANSSNQAQPQQSILTSQHHQTQQQSTIQALAQFQNAPQSHSVTLVGPHIMVQPRTQPAQMTLPMATGTQFSTSAVQPQPQTGGPQPQHQIQLQGQSQGQPLVQGQISTAQVTQAAQVSQLQVGSGQLNNRPGAGIQHQFTPVQFSQLSPGTPLTQVRLAQPGANTQPANPTYQQSQSSQGRAITAGPTLSLIRPQQFKTVNLSLTSAQTMFSQSQPGTAAATHPQATFINMSSSLGGATLISQPIQVLSTSGVQQMVSSMPVQLTAGQSGPTVLMPLQQSGSILHQATVPQVINTLNKNIQPRTPSVITLPTPVQQSILNAQNKGGGISTLTSLPVTATSLSVTGTSACPTATLAIPVASLGMVSPTQVTTTQVTSNLMSGPRTSVPGLQAQQVLNIPRLIARPHLQAIRQADPRQTLILQQPLRTPEKSPTGLTQIRPRDLQGLRSPEAKIIAIQPQSQVQVFNANQTPLSGAVLLSHAPATLFGGDQQIQMPIYVTSPTRVIKAATEDNSLGINGVINNNNNKSLGLPPPLLHVSANPSLVTTSGNLSLSCPNTSTSSSPMPIVNSENKRDVRDVTVASPISTTLVSSEITSSHPRDLHSKDGSSNDNKNRVSVPIEYEEPEFIWEDYLEETGHRAAPETSFLHVENSLKSGLQKGMVVEVTKNIPEGFYWLASIALASGPLLRLRYAGAEDGSQDFWLDVGSPDLHAVGWGAENGKKSQVPEALKESIEDPEKFLVKALDGTSVVPSYLLDSEHGLNPVDQIKPGQRLEVQHELCPTAVWVARIMENVGGRLLLRYEGTDRSQHDFWLFYLDFRLHPIGWAKERECIYKAPDGIKGERQNYAEWSETLQVALKEASENILPADIFQDQEKILTHSFREGWKLEALHPVHKFQICPATVVKVVSKYFIVQIDTFHAPEDSPKQQFLCHGKSPNIFPIRWCQGNGLRITPPSGWRKTEFDWDTYLAYCNNAVPAPEHVFNTVWPEHEFERGMHLEVVNPSQPGQICAASITRTIDHVMWIHLDSCAKIMATHILPVTSHEMFPVGWCASNGYPLKPPRKPNFRRPGRKVAVVQPEPAENLMSADEYRSATYTQIKAGDGGNSWCPKIYFNHRCFSGPFLSKGRIAELPRCVGPGPIQLVLKEVLTMLINVAYKSSRVLREIQLEGAPDPSMFTQTLKAKYKGKSYCAVVELCKSSTRIEQFCRQVCIKLECCPNLFSPNFVNGNCPENCSQLTKTKYTYYYGKKKKRKLGRPPGGHSNLEHGPMKVGKRKKRKRFNLMAHKKSPVGDVEPCTPGENVEEDLFDDDRSSKSTDTSSIGNNDLDADLSMPRKKRKYQHKIPPPSMIKTRGAKLPRYSFERRTHKKIMLSSPPAGRIRPSVEESSIVSTQITEPLYKSEDILKLDSNPLYWSVMDVVKFMKTTDCAHLARTFYDQAIDGQALLLLTLPAVQEHLDLKLGPAIKLCHHIERVKVAFYDQYAK